MDSEIELIEIEKDSGMESTIDSKDETPERKTVRSSQVNAWINFAKLINLFLLIYFFAG